MQIAVTRKTYTIFLATDNVKIRRGLRRKVTVGETFTEKYQCRRPQHDKAAAPIVNYVENHIAIQYILSSVFTEILENKACTTMILILLPNLNYYVK